MSVADNKEELFSLADICRIFDVPEHLVLDLPMFPFEEYDQLCTEFITNTIAHSDI